MAFTTLVLAQLAYVYGVRTDGPCWRAPRNHLLTLATLDSAAFTFAALGIEPLAQALDLTPLSAAQLSLSVALALLPLLGVEIAQDDTWEPTPRVARADRCRPRRSKNAGVASRKPSVARSATLSLTAPRILAIDLDTEMSAGTRARRRVCNRESCAGRRASASSGSSIGRMLIRAWGWLTLLEAMLVSGAFFWLLVRTRLLLRNATGRSRRAAARLPRGDHGFAGIARVSGSARYS